MSGLVSRLISWWLGELSALIPRALTAAPGANLEMRLTADGVELHKLTRAGGAPLGALDKMAEAGAVRRLAKGRRRALIRLAPGQAIRPVVDLPAAAARNLTEALAFEMDRHTPFSADQVRFDAHILPGPKDAERIAVEMEVARRTDVADALATARRFGLDPIRVTGGEDGARAFNLAPLEARPRPGRALPRLVAASAALAVIAGGIAAALWFDRAETRLESAEARLATLRAEAAKTTAAGVEADARRDQAGRLDARKIARPMVTALLDDISHRLSDAHWAERIAIEGDQARIDGLSADASDIVRQLEASPVFQNARFTAAILRDRNTGLDRFSVSARLTPQGSDE